MTAPTTWADLFAAHGLSDPGTESGRLFVLHEVLTRLTSERDGARRDYAQMVTDLQHAVLSAPSELTSADPVRTAERCAAACRADETRHLGAILQRRLANARERHPALAQAHPDDGEFLDELLDLSNPSVSAVLQTARQWAGAAINGDVTGCTLHGHRLIRLLTEPDDDGSIGVP